MRKWSIFAAAISCCLLAHASPAPAAELHAQLFPLTGEVRLLNRDAAPVPFVFYSISSAGGALDGSEGVWMSIEDNYDVSGNGFIDPNEQWFELSSEPTELAEGVFTGPGGSLAAMRAISLGSIWDPFAVPFPDLVFDIREPNEQPVDVTIELALDGDYSANQVVDQADYVLWRRYLNSIGTLVADGNIDGVVDAADYAVWQGNFGLTLPLPPYLAGSGASFGPAGVAPEPATAGLLLTAAACLGMLAARRSR